MKKRMTEDAREALTRRLVAHYKLDEGKAAKEEEKLAGPAIPGLDQGDQMTSQDDVDDLLSSLGF